MDKDIKKNLKNSSSWIRLLFMILFSIIYGTAVFVLWTIVLIQVFFSLITGSANGRLLPFSGQLSAYIYEILLYLAYNREEKPFPFSDWPSSDTVEKL
jgi:hypothetical protein